MSRPYSVLARLRLVATNLVSFKPVFAVFVLVCILWTQSSNLSVNLGGLIRYARRVITLSSVTNADSFFFLYKCRQSTLSYCYGLPCLHWFDLVVLGVYCSLIWLG